MAVNIGMLHVEDRGERPGQRLCSQRQGGPQLAHMERPGQLSFTSFRTP
jgi:hypothetical protein